MRKIIQNSQMFVIFAPAVLLMSLLHSRVWLAVGLAAPARCLDYIKGQYLTAENTVSASPFADFSLDKFKQPATEQQGSTAAEPEKLNENYNVIQEFFTSTENSLTLRKDKCYIKNVTYIPDDEVAAMALTQVGFKAEKNSAQPQILIVHTHATEAYLPDYGAPYDAAYSFRNTDTSQNMVAVGRVMAERLNQLGYSTLQDTTLHDYPSYNGSYDKSKATVEKYLAQYPSIKVVLDVHRDAAERNGAIISPVVDIGGAQCAQIMIISGADNGKMNMPHFWENLKFASAVQNTAATMYPGLMRPVLFDYRNYNQQLSTGSILVEIGTHGATLAQAQRSAALFAEALAAALDDI